MLPILICIVTAENTGKIQNREQNRNHKELDDIFLGQVVAQFTLASKKQDLLTVTKRHSSDMA